MKQKDKLAFFAAAGLLLSTSAALFAQAPIPMPVVQPLDIGGLIVPGGKLCTYAAGTTTPLATYADAALTTPNQNPITADSAGRVAGFVKPYLYKLVLRVGGSAYPASDACTTGTVQWSYDNVGDSGLLLRAGLIGSGGSALVSYKSTLGGSVTRTQASKNGDSVTPQDFGVIADGTTDATAAFQTAITSATAGGKTLRVPRGNYLVKPGEYTGFVLNDGTNIVGEPGAVLKIDPTSGNSGQWSRLFQCMEAQSCADITITGLTVDAQASLDPFTCGGSTCIQTHRRNVVWWEGITGGTVVIENVKVLNSYSANVFLINKNSGGGRAGYVRISNCQFPSQGGGAYDWDSSIIYGFANRAQITHNYIETTGWGVNQAYSGIEFYAQQLTVTDNTVSKFMTGILEGAGSGVIANNNILSTVSGIIHVPLYNSTGDASFTGEGVIIANNKIRIAVNEAPLIEYSRLEGIGFYALADASVTEINGVSITGNEIHYDVFADSSQLSMVDANSHAIGVFTTSPNLVFRNVKIAKNIATNAPYGCIVNATNAQRNWTIEDNILDNCGSMPGATLLQYLYPIRIYSTDSNVLIIRGNTITDPKTTATMQHAIAYSGSLFPNTKLSDNDVFLTGSTTTSFITKYAYTGTPVIRDTLGLAGSTYNLWDSALAATDTAVTVPIGGLTVANGTLSAYKTSDSGIQLLTNPTFTTCASWTAGTGWTCSSGAVATNVSATTINQSGVVAQGKTYHVSFTVANWVPNSGAVLVPTFGGSQALGYVNSNGTYDFTATSLLAGTTFGFTTSVAAVNCTVTNASVQEVVKSGGADVGNTLKSLSGHLILTGFQATPASAGAACTANEITWDTGFIYICVSNNVWKKAAISTW
jgi:hypothetical protein